MTIKPTVTVTYHAAEVARLQQRITELEEGVREVLRCVAEDEGPDFPYQECCCFVPRLKTLLATEPR